MNSNWRGLYWNLANLGLSSGVPIKHESPHAIHAVPQFSPQAPALKRRYSEEPDEMGEKRQRVDCGPPSEGLPDNDIIALLAQATAAATQGIEEALELVQEDDESGLFVDPDEIKEEPPTAFLSDPHLAMRILSLPVLESLVKNTYPVLYFY